MLRNSQNHWTILELLKLTLVFCVICWYLQYHWHRRRLYRMVAKIPGPFCVPIVGNALSFIGNNSEIYKSIMDVFGEYPKGLFRVWLGPDLFFGVSNPDYLQTLLNHPRAFAKMHLYKYAEPIVGQGLFTAPVPKWRKHRKIIMPAFNQKIMDGFVEVFGEQNAILVEKFKKHSGRGGFDIFDYVSKCNLDIICETAMGKKINTQTDESSEFARNVDRFMEIIFLRMFVIWYHFDFVFKFTRMHSEFRKLAIDFQNFTQTIVKEKRAELNRLIKEKPEAQIDENNSQKRKAFLDLLLEYSLETKLSDIEIRDEVNVFMVAGSDTTASSNCFVFLMLAMHPEIQQKVYEEVVEVLGDERNISAEDLPKLTYTERVIKETLRLFPVGAIVVRALEGDISLEDGVVLPRDSSIVIGIMQVHRSAQYWDEPLRFDPERWTRPLKHAYAYLPFMLGPRSCVGPKYAMMAMKSMTAMMVRRFKFYTKYKRVEDVELKLNLMLRPTHGFRLSIEER